MMEEHGRNPRNPLSDTQNFSFFFNFSDSKMIKNPYQLAIQNFFNKKIRKLCVSESWGRRTDYVIPIRNDST